MYFTALSFNLDLLSCLQTCEGPRLSIVLNDPLFAIFKIGKELRQ